MAAMISSQTRDAVTGAAMQRLRAMPGGLNVAHIASDDVEIDALAEILKPVGFYRCFSPFACVVLLLNLKQIDLPGLLFRLQVLRLWFSLCNCRT